MSLQANRAFQRERCWEQVRAMGLNIGRFEKPNRLGPDTVQAQRAAHALLLLNGPGGLVDDDGWTFLAMLLEAIREHGEIVTDVRVSLTD